MQLRSVALIALIALTPRAALGVEGGAKDSVTTHAVAIAIGGPETPNVRCSGTLLSTNVVLTVRHCIAGTSPDAASCAGVFPNAPGAPTDFWVTAAPTAEPSLAWKNVASWVLPTPNHLCGSDIALLVLGTPFAPSESTPAKPVVANAVFHDAALTRLVGIAGFGSTSSAGDDPGVRRSRFDIPMRCVPGEPGFTCNGDLDFIDPSEFTSGAGPCTGDSGAGAMLASDHSTIFGVLSRGNLSTGACGEGIFERTDVWSWLIAKTVLEATPAGATAPDWARAALPDAPKVGELCRGTGCGADADCVSFDGERSYVCAAHCGAGCADGTHCESNVCAPGPTPSPPNSGCSTSGAPPSDVLLVLAALAAMWRLRGLRDRACAASA